MKEKQISRRTMLRGVGTATIGLPFLEEMLVSRALAAPRTAAGGDKIPVRAFNVFFGLGIPKPIQAEGYEGVLEPLKPLRDKLLIMREVDQVRCDESGINAHFDGASGAFTATPPNGSARSGGASLDQVIRRGLYPEGLPSGMVPTLIGGTYFRRSRVSRYVHSYNPDGTVAATMQERPRDLFERVFGAVSMDSKDPDARRKRLQRSVLDSVVEDYRFYTGNNSPLGSASKARVSEHLERIREYEQRAYAMKHRKDGPGGGPPRPPRSQVLHGGAADPGGQGIDITLEELSTEWRLMADLYALAIETDRVRFGSLTFLAAGERIRLTGDYHYGGRKIWTFDDARQQNARAVTLTRSGPRTPLFFPGDATPNTGTSSFGTPATLIPPRPVYHLRRPLPEAFCAPPSRPSASAPAHSLVLAGELRPPCHPVGGTQRPQKSFQP